MRRKLPDMGNSQDSENVQSSDEIWDTAQSVDELKEKINSRFEFYHVHVHFEGYYLRKKAMKLREKIKEFIEQGGFSIDIGPVFDVPGKDGPHCWPSYEIQCSKNHLGPIISIIIMSDHDGLAILVHPLGVGEVLNHTKRAFWIGKQIPLKFEYLQGVDDRTNNIAINTWKDGSDKMSRAKVFQLFLKFVVPSRYGVIDTGHCSARIKAHFSDWENPESNDYEKLLAFWFRGNPNDDFYAIRIDIWFASGAAGLEMDNLIIKTFSKFHEMEANDQLTSWKETPRGNLARIILLDQFSRQMFRGNPKMFAFDEKAQSIALQMLGNPVLTKNGDNNDNNNNDNNNNNNNIHHDAMIWKLAPIERHFVYLCLIHSEHLERVALAVQLIKDNIEEAPKPQQNQFRSFVGISEHHYDQVKQFGRYPYRNSLLGRKSTEEEEEYLRKNDAPYMRSVKKTGPPTSTNSTTAESTKTTEQNE